MRIIPRRIEVGKVRNSGSWVMLYGRRKTGKTFLVEHFLEYDDYFFVNRDGTVFDRVSGEHFTHSEFVKLFPRILGDGCTVIDEFHRLPESFLDVLHSHAGKGRVLLLTSTLWLAKRLLNRKSPLLGVVAPVKVGLIDEREILVEMSRELRGKELVESAVYLREPLLIQPFKPPIREFLATYMHSAGAMVGELVGEAFSEEERTMSEIYEAILRGVSDGKHTSTELSSLLHSRGLISKDNPGVLQKYLTTLVNMGILDKRLVHGKRRKKFVYAHSSPLLDLHFYLEAKYSYTELETPVEFIKKVVDALIPRHVERFVETLLSKVYGFRPVRLEMPDFEVDIALTDFKKVSFVGEVKWKENISGNELRRVEDRLSKFKCRKVIVVPSEDSLSKTPEFIQVVTPDELTRLSKESLDSAYPTYSG
ncbi:AAA family ATPase [Geoglobus sp.]